ncbi:MAG: hypothetical protein HOI23_14390 [Deltaproteobacteria bacterium]|jgi:hypothetical protein|nr:hypothetical protein [Deltaproteobacteria bacterium]MBT6434527.1 hypothetical protein [Deltaproteobacteria bacterium]MBT6488818.1 hypothetical protein [Deltaproteobacteria bacterium]
MIYCIKAFALVLMFITMGCTHALHQNHTSDYQLDRPFNDYRFIQSRQEQFVVMGMIGETDYANAAFADLKKQCPNGTITGIQTRHSTSHGFFSWTNVILMQAYCSE